MSQESKNTTNALLDDRFEDGILDRFERNRYFNGKLMTARDMRTEQHYHAQRLHALARGVVGEGVLEGLDVTVSGGIDALQVVVAEGIALDRLGRLVVVPQDRQVTIDDDPEVLNADSVSVYLEWEECVREAVPVSGTDAACEDECTYNRFLEVYDVDVRETTGDEGYRKGVPDVTFPTRDDLESVDGREAPAADDPGLATIASTYKDEDPEREDGAIFVGTFHSDAEDDGETWWRDDEDPRSRTYSNDLLYAAVARHATDFRNPHEVSLETADPDEGEGAEVAITDDDSDAPSVTFESDDGTVAVEHRADQVLDFSAEDYVTGVEDDLRDEFEDDLNEVENDLDEAKGDLDDVEEALDERLTARERHAAERALKDTALAFRSAADRFRAYRDEAMHVAFMARGAVDARLELDSDEQAAEERTVHKPNGESWFDLSEDVYPDLFERLGSAQAEFATAIEENATNSSFERLELALERLETAIDEADTTRLAAAQDDVCYAVEWLEVSDGVRFEPGTRVLDREDDDPDVAVVLRELTVPSYDWNVYADETVAYQNRPKYEDDPVVLVTFERILDEEWDGWEDEIDTPEELYEAVQERGIKFHAFPRSRLERATPDEPA